MAVARSTVVIPIGCLYFFFGGLLGGLWGDSLSVSDGVGRAESIRCFLFLRFSLRLLGIVGEGQVSMSLVAGAECWRILSERSPTGMVASAIGLPTCARVHTFSAMAAQCQSIWGTMNNVCEGAPNFLCRAESLIRHLQVVL